MATSRTKKAGESAGAGSGTESSEPDLKFEQALERLEKLVSEMESADLPLDQVVKRYEEGTRMVQFCTRKLEEAEQKIEMLARKKDGAVATKPFGAADEEASGDSDATGEAKEGKLF